MKNIIEKVSFGPENDESIKRYEKSSEKLASSHNSFLERIFKSGLISKEDIIRIDARLENDALNNVNTPYMLGEEKLKLLRNSDLILKKGVGERINPEDFREKRWPDNTQRDGETWVLEGIINGQEVHIEHTLSIRNLQEFEVFKGFVNGKECSSSQLSSIWNKYNGIAFNRMSAIADFIHDQKSKKIKEREGRLAKEAKDDFDRVISE